LTDIFKKGIAPTALIRRDFDALRRSEKLRTTHEIQDFIFIQSVEGRSHNGSGVFSKRTYVNTTIDDVVRALNRDPDKVKQSRQALIDDIAAFVQSVINGEKRDRLVNASGEPFLGFEPFRERKVSDRDVLRGLYLGGLRDNVNVRKETEERYQFKIGCGECYLVNTRVMEEMGLDGEKLAHEPHEDEMEEFLESGLIVEGAGAEALNGELRYYYIRHRLGPGQSDDAAVVAAGILYSVDVALGIFLADAVDTLEKYAPEYKDQDQELGFFIGRTFRDLGISMDDVYELSYLCAIPESQEEFIPDSSLRYLLSEDYRSGLSTIESHLAFIEGKPVPAIPISFKRVLNTSFYEYLKKRLLNVRSLDRLAVPEIAVQELNRPVKELARENYVEVQEDESLAEAVRRFKESKKELIVVLDKNGRIKGTLSAADLIDLAK